ncbi:MAG: thermonuclease family protein [Candidatus Scalinduaceae bacterium]
MKQTLKHLSFVFILALLSSSLQAQELVKVIKIIDGDTLWLLDYKGQRGKIKLIGIDAPESKANYKAERDAEKTGQDINTITAMGKRATNYVSSLVKPGDNVRIEFDVRQRDSYGRLLCYVYLLNGKILNEEILKAGYANVKTISPNLKYKDRFLKAYKEARKSKMGLWEE